MLFHKDFVSIHNICWLLTMNPEFFSSTICSSFVQLFLGTTSEKNQVDAWQHARNRFVILFDASFFHFFLFCFYVTHFNNLLTTFAFCRNYWKNILGWISKLLTQSAYQWKIFAKLKNHTHVKKVAHTSEFLFGIWWWTWKTTIY